MKYFVRLLICLMISTTMVELPIMKAHAAGMISTSAALTEMNRAEVEARVTEVLNRSDVQKQLIKLGLGPEEASRRLAALSDKEVKDLAQDIDQATVGGDIGGILVLVLIVVLIIYLVKRI